MKAVVLRKWLREAGLPGDRVAQLTDAEVDYFSAMHKDVLRYILFARYLNVTDIANTLVARGQREARIFKAIFVFRHGLGQWDALHDDNPGLANDAWALRVYELAREVEESGHIVIEFAHPDHVGVQFIVLIRKIGIHVEARGLPHNVRAGNLAIFQEIPGHNSYVLRRDAVASLSSHGGRIGPVTIRTYLYWLLSRGYTIVRVTDNTGDESYALGCLVCAAPAAWAEREAPARVYCGAECQAQFYQT